MKKINLYISGILVVIFSCMMFYIPSYASSIEPDYIISEEYPATEEQPMEGECALIEEQPVVEENPAEDYQTTDEQPVVEYPTEDYKTIDEQPAAEYQAEDYQTVDEQPVVEYPTEDYKTVDEQQVVEYQAEDYQIVDEQSIVDYQAEDYQTTDEQPAVEYPVEDYQTIDEQPVVEYPVEDYQTIDEQPVIEYPVEDYQTIDEQPVIEYPAEDYQTIDEQQSAEYPAENYNSIEYKDNTENVDKVKSSDDEEANVIDDTDNKDKIESKSDSKSTSDEEESTVIDEIYNEDNTESTDISSFDEENVYNIGGTIIENNTDVNETTEAKEPISISIEESQSTNIQPEIGTTQVIEDTQQVDCSQTPSILPKIEIVPLTDSLPDLVTIQTFQLIKPEPYIDYSQTESATPAIETVQQIDAQPTIATTPVVEEAPLLTIDTMPIIEESPNVDYTQPDLPITNETLPVIEQSDTMEKSTVNTTTNTKPSAKNESTSVVESLNNDESLNQNESSTKEEPANQDNSSKMIASAATKDESQKDDETTTEEVSKNDNKSSTLTATATPEVDNNSTSKPVTYSLIAFNITDKTKGAFSENIKVTLEDVKSGKTYEFFLADDTGYLSVGNIITNASYKITLEYPNSNKYLLQNVDGSPIDLFSSTADGNYCDWVIVNTDDVKPVENDLPSSEVKADADIAFNDFYNAVKTMDDNKDWDGFYKRYDVYDNIDSKKYVDIVGGKTSDWVSKKDFDKFLYYETYIKLASYIKQSDYDYYFGSEQNFLDNSVSSTYQSLKAYGDGSEAEAYKKIMLWQYNYISDNGKAYDFVSNLSNVESDNSLVSGQDENISETQNKSDVETTSNTTINTTMQSNVDESNVEQSNIDKLNVQQANAGLTPTSASVGTKNNISKSIMLIGFIVLGFVTAGVVLFIRKRMTVDEDDEE